MDHRSIRVLRQTLHEGLIREVKFRSLRSSKGDTLDISVGSVLDRCLIFSGLVCVIGFLNFNCDCRIIWFIGLTTVPYTSETLPRIHRGHIQIKEHRGGGHETRIGLIT